MVTMEYLTAKLAKAKADQARWESKLRRAATKIRKLKVRVRYYDRQIAEWKPPAPKPKRMIRKFAL